MSHHITEYLPEDGHRCGCVRGVTGHQCCQCTVSMFVCKCPPPHTGGSSRRIKRAVCLTVVSKSGTWNQRYTGPYHHTCATLILRSTLDQWWSLYSHFYLCSPKCISFTTTLILLMCHKLPICCINLVFMFNCIIKYMMSSMFISVIKGLICFLFGNKKQSNENLITLHCNWILVTYVLHYHNLNYWLDTYNKYSTNGKNHYGH